MEKKHCTAIVLAAGQGKRMGTTVQKQYIELDGKPIVFYALDAFERADVIDDIVIVVGKGQEEYCRKHIVEQYGLSKVSAIVEGGKERYDSVKNGLEQVDHQGYVMIHDGARPFISQEVIQRVYNEVQNYPACVVGMPVKDTIYIVDEEMFTKEVPKRSDVWQVQTPQVFDAAIAKEAYHNINLIKDRQITDDAMVIEAVCHYRAKLIKGSYENIKITTPEDLEVAEVFLKRRK